MSFYFLLKQSIKISYFAFLFLKISWKNNETIAFKNN